MSQCALTTVDNPYDPFTQYEAWNRFDEDKGYHSSSYLARIARPTDQLSEAENEALLPFRIACFIAIFVYAN